MNSFVFHHCYFFRLLPMLQDYTQVPQWGSQCTYTPRIRERERELTMVNKCTKTIFFFYLRFKTLTRHPLSGNEMIKYCYCKTRPLKILTVRGRDTPEQDASLAESPVTSSDGGLFESLVKLSCIYVTQICSFEPCVSSIILSSIFIHR